MASAVTAKSRNAAPEKVEKAVRKIIEVARPPTLIAVGSYVSMKSVGSKTTY